MEREIGEIFEYNGEWYQCINNSFSCADCDIKGDCSDTYIGACSSRLRKDGKQVRFKKLEKVGEPYAYTSTTDKIYNVLMQQYKVYYDEILPLVIGHFFILNPQTNTIAIEIKQDKEDMEENKTTFPKEDNALTRLVYNYVNGKISDKDLIESIKELPDKYPYTQNLKEFDLEAAKSGKPVCTRDGRKARIICFDRKGKQPIIALIIQDNGEEFIENYHLSGRFNVDDTFENDGDLMMLPEKKEGWAKIRKDINLYDTKEEADRKMIGNDEYVTAKVCWEE